MEQSVMDLPAETVTKTPQTGAKGISIADIIEYSDKGLGPREIAKLVGCDHANVIRRLRAVGYSKQSAKNFREHKDRVFENLQERFIGSITTRDINKVNADKRIIATAILEDKIRLIRGQSTQNISNLPMSQEMKDIETRAKASETELAALQAQLAALEAREAGIIDVTPDPPGVSNQVVRYKKVSKGKRKGAKGA